MNKWLFTPTHPDQVVPPPARPKAFKTGDDVLDAGYQMILARRAANEAKYPNRRCAAGLARQWYRCFHGSAALTGDDIVLCKRFRDARLSAVEREVLMALLLDYVAADECSLRTCADVIRFLGVTRAQAAQARRSLSQNGRLTKTGVVILGDEPHERSISLEVLFVEEALKNRNSQTVGWDIPRRCLDGRLPLLKDAMAGYIKELGSRRSRSGGDNLYRLKFLWTGLARTLDAHPRWRLEPFWRELAELWMAGKRSASVTARCSP